MALDVAIETVTVAAGTPDAAEVYYRATTNSIAPTTTKLEAVKAEMEAVKQAVAIAGVKDTRPIPCMVGDALPPPPPTMPQEIHNRIETSQDRLFFVAYMHS